MREEAGLTTLRQNVAHAPLQLSLLTERKHEAAFLRHRHEHPEVFAELVATAREAKARGWTKLGVRAIWERMRWRRGPKQRDSQGFHMNDHLTSFYARAIRAECPDLAEFFEVRER